MTCTECDGDTKVTETRKRGGNGCKTMSPHATKRRHVCLSCGHRFTTLEQPLDAWDEDETEPTPLGRLAHALDVEMFRYERDSKDEAATLARAAILLEQVTTAIVRAYRDSAEDERRQAKRDKGARRGAA